MNLKNLILESEKLFNLSLSYFKEYQKIKSELDISSRYTESGKRDILFELMEKQKEVLIGKQFELLSKLTEVQEQEQDRINKSIEVVKVDNFSELEILSKLDFSIEHNRKIFNKVAFRYWHNEVAKAYLDDIAKNNNIFIRFPKGKEELLKELLESVQRYIENFTRPDYNEYLPVFEMYVNGANDTINRLYNDYMNSFNNLEPTEQEQQQIEYMQTFKEYSQQ